MSEAMTKIKETQLKMKELKAKAVNEIQQLFTEATKELFDANPTLKSFGWEQFTIYFNDGDACNFAVYGDYPNINGVEGYVIEDYNYESNKELITPERQEVMDLFPIVKNFVWAIEQDFMEDMFGDHKRIKITRDKVEVEDYSDHD